MIVRRAAYAGGKPINARVENPVRRTVCPFLVLFCAFFAALAYAAEHQDAVKLPELKASSAILVDADSGQVLFSKNPDLSRPPASTTKIMTAILLLERTKPEDVIVASKHAEDVEGSSLNLRAGEKITAHDMLFALMLRSANDGCVAVAEHVAGSEAKFAEMMSAKAREIGATHTTFRNCNGLNQPANKTTARDLSTMARYASRYPAFNEATRTKFHTIARSSDDKDVILRNHAKFLWKFAGADGVKTGYTVPAGHCFVGAANWNGWRLISVVLNSPDIFGETGQLIKFGFKRFEQLKAADKGQVVTNVPVTGGTAPIVIAASAAPVHVVVPRGTRPEFKLEPHFSTVPAPVHAGATVGSIEVRADGKLVGTAHLVATQTVERAKAAGASAGRSGYLAVALIGTAVVGYGTAIAKTARRRGYRLSAILRGAYRRR